MLGEKRDLQKQEASLKFKESTVFLQDSRCDMCAGDETSFDSNQILLWF